MPSSHLIDLTGQTFTRLTVICKDRPKFGNELDKAAFWRCKCVCGHITIVRGDHLRKGRTKSCSCLRGEISANWNKDRKGLTRAQWAEKVSQQSRSNNDAKTS
jgi:dTDP-4-dehydrorhamnose 3,5-epimerase-like enzyme